MKRKLLIGIVSAIVLIVVIVAVTGREATVSGTYLCIQGSTEGDQFWRLKEGSRFDFRRDGTGYHLGAPEEGGPANVVKWRVEGNEIVISTEVFGATFAWRGQVEGDSIVLEDGSVWVKQQAEATLGAMGPSELVKAFYEAFSKEQFSEVVGYYGPRTSAEVLRTRVRLKTEYPEKGDAVIWRDAIVSTVGEAFYLEWREDGWITLRDMERVQIISETISEDGKTATVEYTVYCKYGVEYSATRRLIKMRDVWQIGE